MRGFVTEPAGIPEPAGHHLRPWEIVACDAVGTVIEFWGFKHNQGRVWALLYLRGEPYTAAVIQHELGLSKGGVSILMRELEQWGVVRRVRQPGQRAWNFEAERDLMAMIRLVLQARESRLVSRVLADLERAEELIRQDPTATRGQRERLTRMLRLARAIDKAVATFMKTARLDAGRAVDALRRGSHHLRRRSSRLRPGG
jgi:HTH-type transcriptional regulator, glycine betaine synthesis regulator